MTPGLTGVAQLLLPRDVPREVKFRYDVWYVRNRTFRLDLRLMVMSLVISARGHWETNSRNLALVKPLRARVTCDLERDFQRAQSPRAPATARTRARKAAGKKAARPAPSSRAAHSIHG